MNSSNQLVNYAFKSNSKHSTKNISTLIKVNHMQSSSSMNKGILILRLRLIQDISSFAKYDSTRKQLY